MTQIADQMGVHKSTVHRLLATLERRRFVQRDPATGAYNLGIRLFQMAYLTLEHNDLSRLATPFLRRPMEELRQVREQGFALSEQEFEDGINAVAAPILDLGNQPVAAIAVAGPAYRLTLQRMAEIGPDVVATARDISRELEMVANVQVGAGGHR